jgi:HK97 family phage major capsid protein
VDELIRKLQERRAKIAEQRDGHLKVAETNIDCSTDEQRSAYKAATDAAAPLAAELREIDDRLKDLREQRERDARAADARKGDPGPVGDPAAGRAHVTSEPGAYGRGEGQSYFLDQARVQMAQAGLFQSKYLDQALERQKRHAQEIDKRMPERRAAVERRAAKMYEDAFASSPDDQRRMARMERAGISPFEREKRFISRTDGQGGYFVPPLWLIDEYIPYLRAGRVFADMWRSFPLPAGTDSINIPRVTLGTATGPQTADGANVPGRDMTDNFVNALVRTVAGQQDAAIQLLDQSPIAFDEIVFGDLMADYAMQLSGQLMIGSGTNGQLTGLFSAGTLGTSSGASTSGYVVNDAADAWTAASGTANFYSSAGKLLSNIARNRLRPVSGVIANTAVWYAYATSVDGNQRPLVAVNQQGQFFNAAGQQDGGLTVEGPVGHILSAPWSIDPNIPLTFGGTNAPYIGTISNGNTAAVPGSGGSPDFTPLIAAVWDDLYLWEGELRSRVLSEVLSGSLQVRFQVYGYCADMPNRYQDSSGNPVSYGNYNNTGQTAASVALSTAGLLSGF